MLRRHWCSQGGRGVQGKKETGVTGEISKERGDKNLRKWASKATATVGVKKGRRGKGMFSQFNLKLRSEYIGSIIYYHLPVLVRCI